MRTIALMGMFLAGTMSLAVSGCGGGDVPTYRVSGTVKFKDGSPLTKGTVFFDGDAHSANGQIGEDGSYYLGSFSQSDGAPVGTYKVYIGGDAAGSGYVDLEAGDKASGGPLVANKYLSAETSGLTFEVKAQSNEFNIEVEKPN